MSIERLTAEDQMMLWPDEIWPQDIGAVAALDGRGLLDAAGRFRIEVFRDAVASRLHLMPRLRQVLQVPARRELGGPIWVDAPAFDITDHVQVMWLPAPGDEAQLMLAVELARRRPLDRSRPLWEMWLLPGLRDGRVGMYVRTHHTIGDGLAGVATLVAFLEVDPEVTRVPGQPWSPAPGPLDAELRADKQRRHRAEMKRNLASLSHPVTTTRELAATWPALREVLAEKSLPATSLDRVVGPDRTIALIRSRIDLVRDVAHAHGAKVNDVLLTVIAGGLRRLLISRGEPVENVVLRIYVPVSLRHGQYADARGNRVAQMVVPVPIGVSDPVTRLHQITAETGRRKARSRPSLGKLPVHGIAGRAALKLVARQRVNVTTADLPGPTTPLYLAGSRVLEVFPVIPLIGRVSLGVGAMSYAGQFNIAAVGDRDGYPDMAVFVAGVEEELHTLELGVTRESESARSWPALLA
jgi:WS/DGAT/MGAT family acyltransferase